jgi:dethiobiotin synthetase
MLDGGNTMINFPETLFITGADEHVGKTFVSAVLTLGLKGCYWKPIQCGVSPCTDTEWVHEATGLPHSHFLKESYRFGEPLLPHAQHTGIEIESLKPEKPRHPYLIVEGAGGIMLPLNEKELVIDFMKAFNAPTLLVIKNNHGAINQALLTLEKLEREKIPIFGVLLNGTKDQINRRAIQQHAKFYPVFEMDFVSHITEHSLKEAFTETFTN